MEGIIYVVINNIKKQSIYRQLQLWLLVYKDSHYKVAFTLLYTFNTYQHSLKHSDSRWFFCASGMLKTLIILPKVGCWLQRSIFNKRTPQSGPCDAKYHLTEVTMSKTLNLHQFPWCCSWILTSMWRVERISLQGSESKDPGFSEHIRVKSTWWCR